MRPRFKASPIGALAAALVFSTPFKAAALANNEGASTAQFLRLGPGARALGMGEAYGPVAEGPDAIYWNPSGLAQIRQPELSYSHVEMLRFFHYDFLAYAHPVPALGGTIAGSATSLYQDSLGLVTNTDQQIGSFRPHSEAFSVAFARPLTTEEGTPRSDRSYIPQSQRISRWVDWPVHESDYPWRGRMLFGLAAKVVTETLQDHTAVAGAADGGLLYVPQDLESLRLSFAFRNLGTKERFIRESEDLPAEIDLGLAWDARGETRRFLTAMELALPFYGSVNGRLGLEYSTAVGRGVSAALRAGYKTLSAPDLGPLSGLTAGVGLQYARVSIDLAAQPMAALGELYRFGFNIAF